MRADDFANALTIATHELPGGDRAIQAGNESRAIVICGVRSALIQRYPSGGLSVETLQTNGSPDVHWIGADADQDRATKAYVAHYLADAT